jgi:dienelactone hydrolase
MIGGDSSWCARSVDSLMRACLCASALTLASSASAQDAPLAFPPRDPRVQMSPDVLYASGPEAALRMDVYRTEEGSRKPALVFFIRAMGPERHQPVFDAWARAAAGRGLVAILPDLRAGHEAEDVDRVHAYLAAHAADLNVDADNTAVFAVSGNVASALPAVEDPRRTWITAAAMFYGAAPVPELRRDVPLLLVRAGLDRPGVGVNILRLVERALQDNVPLTLLNEQTGHHGFDLVDRDAATRAAVEQTLDFVARATARDYQAALRAGAPEAAAAAHVANGRFAEAAAAYRPLTLAQPDNATLRLSYGEALLGSGQFAEACAVFDQLRNKGLGARDLGLPAAEACLKKGDADAAIAWLRSIPPQFRPPTLRENPAFAALRGRPEFLALFSDR